MLLPLVVLGFAPGAVNAYGRRREHWPPEYGVMHLESVPRGFWSQTWMPMGPKRTFDDYVGGPQSVADT